VTPALFAAWVLAAPLAAAGEAVPAPDLAPGGPAERLYREGRSRDGEPVRATVLGDVETVGGQVSCAACHGRSGMGSAEGVAITPPITARALLTARPGGRPRPAYDTATLARALREGLDPAGRPLDPLMPRYRLSPDDERLLAAYLARLSAGPSPGVEDAALHLAVVVAPDAPLEVREETLEVARRYVEAQNEAARDLRVRHRADLRAAAGRPVFYGDWVLHPWTLSGAPRTWRAQLEHLQRARPVFAVVSGAAGREWGPVHAFCEAERLPCLLPNVATPPGEPGWYSLYFSRGARLEADAVAAHVRRAAGPGRVLQVYRRTGPGAEAARALSVALGPSAVGLPLAPGEPAPERGRLEREVRRYGAAALVLWLEPRDLRALGATFPAPVYVSTTLLGGDAAAAGALGAAPGWLLQPHGLAGERGEFERPQRLWLARHGLPAAEGTRARIRDQTLFAFGLFSQGIMHLARERSFQRDFLLEILDHASALQLPSAVYPHLGFGPGQRHLSKGCHLVPLGGPEEGAEWVVP